MRGSVGARLSDTSGDVDIFRIEVPPSEGRKVLVAEWHGERAGEGIRGLDVALALNRERPAEDARTSAPLVATANRGGPGRPERLVAAVEPGVYYLSVREVHDEATGPVEKPTDRYLLSVHLADPRPGEELEPNDGPDRSASRFERYPEWRATAERNVLGEGNVIRGDTAPDDPDLYAVAPRADGEAPELVVAVPDPGLALVARLWRPDAEDLAPTRAQDRVRFEEGGAAAGGEALVLAVRPRPRADAPALVLLRGREGQGRYAVVALGPGAASVQAVKALVRELEGAGRGTVAGAVAHAFALAFPEAAVAAGLAGTAAALEPAAAGTLDPGSATSAGRRGP